VLEKPAFIQGCFEFVGQGLNNPVSFLSPAMYKVPPDRRAQTIYFRAGNPAAEMIYLMLTRGGKAMRYFPVGARGSVHVPLAVLEDLSPGSVIEVLIGAPDGMKSLVVLDVGFMEIA
jgi:assimilatory nitrate reductase catalytic subunit